MTEDGTFRFSYFYSNTAKFRQPFFINNPKIAVFYFSNLFVKKADSLVLT